MTNPDGALHRYAWIGETLIPLEPTSHPEYVAPVDPLETAAADAAYLAQTMLEMWNPPERVMEQGDEFTTDDIPLGLNAEQVRDALEAHAASAYRKQFGDLPWQTRQSVIADWKGDWFDNPHSWIDYDAIGERLPVIKAAAERWHHPDSGMSEDEFAALLIANLRQEAHYRRQEPSVYKMSPGEFGLNLLDIIWDHGKNEAASIAGHIGLGDGDPSVGPANLRIKVAEEMLGTGTIPMPEGEPLDFDDVGRLDHLVRQWQNLETAVERRRFLKDDANAIELMAANLYRGVVRLTHQGLQPTMFNLSTWWSQGIAESSTLRDSLDNPSVTHAINHARATVPLVSAILQHYEAFELKASPDGFIVFNEDDLHAYTAIEQ